MFIWEIFLKDLFSPLYHIAVAKGNISVQPISDTKAERSRNFIA